MPWAAIIPAVISAGGGIASGIIGSKAQKAAEERARNSPEAIAQREAIAQQQRYGAQAGAYGTDFLDKYKTGTNEQIGWLHKLLSDDNTEALKVIAPEVRAVKQGYSSNLRSAEFKPRGGGTGESMYNLQGQQNADILSLLQGERNTGRQNLMQLLGDVGARGQGLLGSASGSATNAASLLGTIADRNALVGQVAGQRASQTVSDAGNSLAVFLQLMRMGQNNNGGGGGNLGAFLSGISNNVRNSPIQDD
jgi:hypothetical protein